MFKYLNVCPPIENPYNLQPQELCDYSVDPSVQSTWERTDKDEEKCLKNAKYASNDGQMFRLISYCKHLNNMKISNNHKDNC